VVAGRDGQQSTGGAGAAEHGAMKTTTFKKYYQGFATLA
jgi:hypothetical protein